jgi:hypothetical protein
MDPYLEGSLWTTLHFTLAAEIVRYLAPQLRPKYLALPVERFVMEMSSDIAVTTVNIYPDVGVARSDLQKPTPSETAVISAPLRLATVIPAAIPHVTVEIRDAARRQLVTAIEILSPTNKRGAGAEEYLTKRRRILLSSAHLLEIDLLRDGQRVPMQQPLPAAPYFVLLSRADDRPMTEVWPIALDQPLPTVSVPLLAGDPDVLLNLQSVFTSVYDLLGYDLVIDYRQPPEIKLPDKDLAWVNQHLRQQGIRI